MKVEKDNCGAVYSGFLPPERRPVVARLLSHGEEKEIPVRLKECDSDCYHDSRFITYAFREKTYEKV